MAEQPRHVLAVTGCVRDASGRVLLVRVASRGWEMPGGRVEEGLSEPERLLYRTYRARPYEALGERWL